MKNEVTKLFFDTEFTGLHKDTTLISIGIISEDNKCFYAESTEYAKEQCCDEWIKENVINKLIIEGNQDLYNILKNVGATFLAGTIEYIRDELKKWLKQFDTVQFVSDVSHYDFVLLIDIFGSAFDLPENVSPSCHDINQDIAEYFNISEKEAFDLDRENIIKKLRGQINSVTYQHNSIYDAYVIKTIYNYVVYH